MEESVLNLTERADRLAVAFAKRQVPAVCAYWLEDRGWVLHATSRADLELLRDEIDRELTETKK